jgi:hypothetical protein
MLPFSRSSFTFPIQVRVVHDGDPIFPKEVAKAMEAFMEAQADEDGITYDELRAVDRRSSIMLWPGALRYLII